MPGGSEDVAAKLSPLAKAVFKPGTSVITELVLIYTAEGVLEEARTLFEAGALTHAQQARSVTVPYVMYKGELCRVMPVKEMGVQVGRGKGRKRKP